MSFAHGESDGVRTAVAAGGEALLQSSADACQSAANVEWSALLPRLSAPLDCPAEFDEVFRRRPQDLIGLATDARLRALVARHPHLKLNAPLRFSQLVASILCDDDPTRPRDEQLRLARSIEAWLDSASDEECRYWCDELLAQPKTDFPRRAAWLLTRMVRNWRHLTANENREWHIRLEQLRRFQYVEIARVFTPQAVDSELGVAAAAWRAAVARALTDKGTTAEIEAAELSTDAFARSLASKLSELQSRRPRESHWEPIWAWNADLTHPDRATRWTGLAEAWESFSDASAGDASEECGFAFCEDERASREADERAIQEAGCWLRVDLQKLMRFRSELHIVERNFRQIVDSLHGVLAATDSPSQVDELPEAATVDRIPSPVGDAHRDAGPRDDDSTEGFESSEPAVVAELVDDSGVGRLVDRWQVVRSALPRFNIDALLNELGTSLETEQAKLRRSLVSVVELLANVGNQDATRRVREVADAMFVELKPLAFCGAAETLRREARDRTTLRRHASPLTAAGEARRAVLAASVLGLIVQPAAKWAELPLRLQELQRYDNEEHQTRIAWQRLLTGVPPSARSVFARFQLTEGQLSMANGLDSIVIRLRAEAELLRAELASQLELRNQRLRNLARLGGELGAVLDAQPTSEPSSKPSAPPAWFAEEYRMLGELLAQVDCDRESELRLEQFENALRGEVVRRVRTAASSEGKGEGEGDAAPLPFARSMSDPWPVFAEFLQRDAFDEFRVAAEELTQVATAAREISLQIGAHYSLLEGLLELEDLRRDWDVEPELAAYAATLAEFMAETRQLGEVVRDAARRRRFAEVVDALKSRFGRQRPGNLRTALTNLFIDKNRCLEGVKVAGASSPGPVTSQAKIPDVLDWLRNKLWPNFEQLDAAVRVELTNGGLQPPRRLADRSTEKHA